MYSSYVKCSWKLEKSLWTIVSDVWGTVHAMCGQKFGMSEQRHIFRRAWSSGLTLESTGVSLKLFGPFPLVPGLTKHLCVLLWRAQPGLTYGTLPSLVVAHVGLAHCHSQDHLAEPKTEWAGGGRGTRLGKPFPVNQSIHCLKCWSGWENAHSASV